MGNVTVYTDGGCINNPGGKGGVGIVVIENENISHYSAGYLSTTNNRMEIRAAIMALEMVKPGSNVNLYSDSKILVETMSGRMNYHKNLDLWELLFAVMRTHAKVQAIWVKGHADNQYNEMCDRLASCAMNSKDLLEDIGYNSLTAAGKKNLNKKGSSTKESVAPLGDDLPDVDFSLSVSDDAERKHLTIICSESIRIFCKKKQHSFKDYIELKTGGIDYYSKKPESYFLSSIDERKTTYIQNNLPDKSMCLSAFRWHARGLTAYDAVMKVITDNELKIAKMRGKKKGR